MAAFSVRTCTSTSTSRSNCGCCSVLTLLQPMKHALLCAWPRDLGVGLDTREADHQPRLPWRAGDMMVTLGLAQRGSTATLTLRASGTEPKLKYYLEVGCAAV